jgi:hypothetical protein
MVQQTTYENCRQEFYYDGDSSYPHEAMMAADKRSRKNAEFITVVLIGVVAAVNITIWYFVR